MLGHIHLRSILRYEFKGSRTLNKLLLHPLHLYGLPISFNISFKLQTKAIEPTHEHRSDTHLIQRTRPKDAAHLVSWRYAFMHPKLKQTS